MIVGFEKAFRPCGEAVIEALRCAKDVGTVVDFGNKEGKIGFARIGIGDFDVGRGECGAEGFVSLEFMQAEPGEGEHFLGAIPA